MNNPTPAMLDEKALEFSYNELTYEYGKISKDCLGRCIARYLQSSTADIIAELEALDVPCPGDRHAYITVKKAISIAKGARG